MSHKKSILKQGLAALTCLILLSFSVKGQVRDSLKSYNDTIKSSFKKKPKLTFRWDSHGSFITNTPARMTALGLGLKFDRVKVGISADWLNTDIYRIKIIPAGGSEQGDTVNAKLNYGLFCIYSNFVLRRVKKWELSIPFELGFGQSSYTYYTTKGEKREYAKGGMLTIEPMFIAEYKVFKWFGVGAGLGLRLVPFSNKLVKENFNSLLWDANLNIYFGEIYRIVKASVKKHKLEKEQKKHRPKF